MWPERTVFILGGGPSLLKTDLRPLYRGQRVIGVNNAFELGPWVDVCLFGDIQWFHWNLESLRRFGGLVVSAHPGTWPAWVKPMLRGKPEGIETRRGFLSWNRSSGGAAVNLAVHLGAKRIVLIGYDMRLVDGKKNWHNKHKERPHDPFERFLRPWKLIRADCAKLGVEIFNATPGSALTLFPFVTVEEMAK